MWHFNEPLFLRYIYIYAINNCQKKLKRNKMAKESSVRVASIRSSCMYEVADFFIIIGLYVFQIRIQFCNFFFFFLFLFNHAQVTEVSFSRIDYIDFIIVFTKKFFIDSRLEKSEGKRSKKNIYICIYKREKMQTVLQFRKKYSYYIFFFFFLLFFFFYFLNCDRRKI